MTADVNVPGVSGVPDIPNVIFVAPTEPAELKKLGRSTLLPEQFGVDVLISVPSLGFVGVQRKTWADLYASMSDGRLAFSRLKMGPLALAVLLVEGRIRWNRDGVAIEEWMNWTRPQANAFLLSLQAAGFVLMFTDNLAGTCESIRTLGKWAAKSDHRALSTIPKAKGKFGLQPTGEERAAYVLQAACPGIGAKTSFDVVKVLGVKDGGMKGGLPLSWTCEFEELLAVPGVGAGRAKAIWEAFGGVVPVKEKKKRKKKGEAAQ